MEWLGKLKNTISNTIRTSLNRLGINDNVIRNVQDNVRSVIKKPFERVRNVVRRVGGIDQMAHKKRLGNVLSDIRNVNIITHRRRMRNVLGNIHNANIIYDQFVNNSNIRRERERVERNIQNSRITHLSHDYYDLVRVVSDRPEQSEAFGLGQWQYTIQFDSDKLRADVEDFEHLVNIVSDSINQLVKTVVKEQNLREMDIVTVRPDGTNGNHNHGWRVGAWMTPDDVAAKDWCNINGNFLQSWYLQDFEREFSLTVTTFRVPNGRGRDKPSVITDNKKSIYIVNNTDSMCCARALAVCIVWDEYKKCDDMDFERKNQLKNKHTRYTKKDVKKIEKWEQTIHAKELYDLICKKYNVETTPEDILKWEKVLNVKIKIIKGETGSLVTYSGSDEVGEDRPVYYLRYSNNHYDAIKSITGYLGVSYFCNKCDKGFNDKSKHLCDGEIMCKLCLTKGIDHRNVNKRLEWVKCAECKVSYIEGECFKNHLDKNLCEKKIKCELCNTILKTQKEINRHICGYKDCESCRVYTDLKTHACFMKPEEVDCEKVKAKLDKYFYFDLESRQEKMDKQGLLKHIVNYAILQDYRGNTVEFDYGDGTLDKLCYTIFQKKNCGYTFIAHNLKGYDGQFILKWVLDHGLTPEIILSGSKIMHMVIPKYDIKFIDSINFFQRELAQLPEMFNLDNIKKGYFPHSFNTLENQNYVGKYPNESYYAPDKMKVKDRVKFEEWYHGVKNDVFDFKKEMREYCTDDVNILRRSCQSFQESFMNITEGQVDPFQKVTIASACMSVYKIMDLKKEKIAIINNSKYMKEKESLKAIMCFEYLNHKSNYKIQHAGNGPQKRIKVKSGKEYKVDGYIESTDTVYEFDGCYWHGCEKCYTSYKVNKVSNKSMIELRKATEARQNEIRECVKSLIVIKECEWDKKVNKYVCECLEVHSDLCVENKKEILEYKKWERTFDKKRIIGKLSPRKAFFGGRTEGFNLYHECSDDEKILYFDYTSLYPTVNKYGWYPIGHSKVYKEITVDEAITKKGLIYCDILAPRGLYYPVLPLKVCGKLNFVLCRTCGEASCEDTCEHDDKERMLRGTWTHLEILKAIEKGYKIDKVHSMEVFEQGEIGLFKDYVNRFLKIKQEASGWPKDCETDDQKNEYLKTYYEREGILLDKSKIVKNDGLRNVAKTILNSLWHLGSMKNS